MESKPRILYLLRILEQYTDEEHPLTTKQLIEMLNENMEYRHTGRPLQRTLPLYRGLVWIL